MTTPKAPTGGRGELLRRLRTLLSRYQCHHDWYGDWNRDSKGHCVCDLCVEARLLEGLINGSREPKA